MNPTASLRDRWDEYVLSLQDEICNSLEALDGQATFREDRYKRIEANGGGGRTRIMSDGAVFEKAGVNTSSVQGEVTDVMRAQLHIDGARWYACGLSLVLHPLSPTATAAATAHPSALIIAPPPAICTCLPAALRLPRWRGR